MTLSDINTTVFQTLTPEVQQKLIEAQQASTTVDPIVVGLFVAMIIIPLILIR